VVGDIVQACGWTCAPAIARGSRDIFMSTPFELPDRNDHLQRLETRDAMLAWVTEQTAKSARRWRFPPRSVSEMDGPACN
jgi:hypothetical protein